MKNNFFKVFFLLIIILFNNLYAQNYASDILAKALNAKKQIIILQTSNISDLEYDQLFNNVPLKYLENKIFFKIKLKEIFISKKIKSNLIQRGCP